MTLGLNLFFEIQLSALKLDYFISKEIIQLIHNANTSANSASLSFVSSGFTTLTEQKILSRVYSLRSLYVMA